MFPTPRRPARALRAVPGSRPRRTARRARRRGRTPRREPQHADRRAARRRPGLAGRTPSPGRDLQPRVERSRAKPRRVRMRPHWGLEQRFASGPERRVASGRPALWHPGLRGAWWTRPVPLPAAPPLPCGSARRRRESPAKATCRSLTQSEESGGEAQLGAGGTGVEASAKVGGAVADPLGPLLG